MDTGMISEALTQRRGTRRQLLKGLGWGVAGVAGMGMLPRIAQAAGGVGLDVAIGQFALNLEYLEAQFYTYAVTGQGIEAQGLATDGSGTKGGVTIKSNPQVPFSDPKIQQYAAEIGQDERNHVALFRGFLTAAGVQPVAQPQLDLQNSFNTLAQAAGIGSSFDPFANDINFLLGAFIFEDVGVTLFGGAAKLLTNRDLLDSAAGVLAVEAYHAANIRAHVFEAGSTAQQLAQKISDVRKALSGADDDQGVVDSNGKANIQPTDANGRAFRRSARQGLNIVYGAVNAAKGLFFPNGLNGAITK